MNIKFTGPFQELKKKLEPLKGEWDESQSEKKVFRVENGVLNWFTTTGTLSVQGKNPGKDQIEKSVPHLLYPNEYEKAKTVPAEVENKEQNSTANENVDIGIEYNYLFGNINITELVIGVVCSVGTESKRVIDSLTEQLKGFGYNVEEIRLSKLLPPEASANGEYERIKHYMKEGDKLRKRTENNAILAAGASHKIKESRNGSPSKNAYIVNSLKHPDEVTFLRKIYTDGFYLFGLHADEKRRHNYLTKKHLKQFQASELIRIDEDEKIPHGQRTRDTFHLSDFYINIGKDHDQVTNTIQRFLELIFSNPYKNPTFDEFAMFMAFNSSIRSSDLSRQVGAIIARNQQIIATGANDCPKPGGGQYWAEVEPSTGEVKDIPGGKDYTREQDSNKAAQNEMISEIAKSLVDAQIATDKSAVEGILRQSKISDLTEFGRVVHAEMEAILSCAREGIQTTGATLYCTTFPCHNCAKHIIDAGIIRVVYVEPYPKSRALEHHSESIYLKTSLDDHPANNRVTFEPFTGVGARRFLDLFSMSFGGGSKLKRKDQNGNITEWKKEKSSVRTPLLPKSYLEIEEAASAIWKQSVDR
ncbi:MAG: cytidine deaminase [Magnetococcales bacterium]|nr:cytidine deaminase [Magnetococcales bacterium]